MNDKRNFLTIDALSTKINEKVKRITRGKLKIQMLEQLLDEVKDLQERLIILKYKAMEKVAERPVEKNLFNLDNAPEEVDKPSLKFTVAKKPEIPENQISLIDSIAEISSEMERKEKKVEKPSKVDVQEKVAPKVSPKKSIDQSVNKKHNVKEKKVKREKDKKITVRQKIKATPIDHIIKAIKLNARIGMTKQLFGGDGDMFQQEVGKLDAATSGAQANEYLRALKLARNWQDDNKWYMLLCDLVERKFIQK